MRLRSNLAEPAYVRHRGATWQPSPQNGVDRLMLERVGGEKVSRASSIVSYEAGSSFPRHVHGGGEEFLVLDGTFSDDTGDFKKGFYVRNPVGSVHAPWSERGTTIFVKLGQIDPEDQSHVRIDTSSAVWRQEEASGIMALRLHNYGKEIVRLVQLEPGASLPARNHSGGAEILVVEGSLETEIGQLEELDWLRVPAGDALSIRSERGCTVYMKTGHLG